MCYISCLNHTVALFINPTCGTLTLVGLIRCKSWNVSVRIIYLPYNTHTWILGPLLGQTHIRNLLYVRNFSILVNAFNSANSIIRTCINEAMYNANTCIGHKLTFYRYTFDLNM